MPETIWVACPNCNKEFEAEVPDWLKEGFAPC